MYFEIINMADIYGLNAYFLKYNPTFFGYYLEGYY